MTQLFARSSADGVLRRQWLGLHVVGKSAIDAGADLARLGRDGLCQDRTHAPQQGELATHSIGSVSPSEQPGNRDASATAVFRLIDEPVPAQLLYRR